MRRLGLVEGVSTLILFFIAMPLKYFAGMPAAVTWVGSIHGALFVALGLAVSYCWWKARWPFKRPFQIMVAAVFPFGPFLMDRKIKEWDREYCAAPDGAPAKGSPRST